MTQEEKEICREEVLRVLAEREAVKLSAPAVRRAVNRDGATFSQDAIDAALRFHVSLHRVTEEPHPDGATLFYQVTAEGTLAHERGGR